jgi:hypothetical protein
MKLKVERAFLLGGIRQEVGSEIEVNDKGLAGLLVSTGKASQIELTEETGPMTTETASGSVRGKRKAARKEGTQS